MAEPLDPPASILFVAAFSGSAKALQWTRDRLSTRGQVVLASEVFEHRETAYYEKEMGHELIKQFFVVDGLYDPAGLAQAKLESNAWEKEYANSSSHAVSRPLNIDPGYLTLGKLILASAKDRAHRIYLQHGIYAEECLFYSAGGWQTRPWTYPDYQRADFHVFFEAMREKLKAMLREQASGERK